MSNIQSSILSSLKAHDNKPIVIAYSGGVDSQVLLHAVSQLIKSNELDATVSACHVNHGLSEHAKSWQTFAEQQCIALQIPLFIKQVVINKKNRQSLEALARDARYQAFTEVANESSVFLTGHHQDDQVETFLLATKRGAGLKGLSAMAEQSLMVNSSHLLIRPLLSIPRAEVVDYAKKNNLAWIEDESNQDAAFDRNFLRQNIIPQLKERWSGIDKTIVRSAQHCRDAQALLTEIAEQDLQTCLLDEGVTYNNVLDINQLIKLSTNRFNYLIRHFLAKQHCLMPSQQQLLQVQQQLSANADRSPSVKVGDMWLRRYQEKLYLTKAFQDLTSWQAELDFEALLLIENNALALPDDLGVLTFINSPAVTEDKEAFYAVIKPKKNEKVSIRFFHDNPRCIPDYREKSRSLKKVLQELNIPPWQRKRIPFLYYGEQLVAGIGYFVCKAYLAKNSKANINIHWLDN